MEHYIYKNIRYITFFLSLSVFQIPSNSYSIEVDIKNSVSNVNEIVGNPRVKDGDTIEIYPISIRLSGIDAPEKDQPCFSDRGQYMCGLVSYEFLYRLIGDKVVVCKRSQGNDTYGRTLAVCRLHDGTDINEAMVRSGNALAYRKYSQDYVHAEDDAKEHKRGIWSGTFMYPWEWRKMNRSR